MYQAVDYLRHLQAEESNSEDELDDAGYNLYIQPPDVDYDSGSDDANENVGVVLPEHLHFNQFNQLIVLEFPVLEGALYELDDVVMAEEPSSSVASSSAGAASSTIRTSTSISAPVPKTKWAYVGKHIDIPSKESCPGVSTKFKYRQETQLNATVEGIFPTHARFIREIF